MLITSQLWRDTVTRLAAEFPEVTLEHQLVDSFAMRLVQRPAGVDVVVTENLFGDILSDEAGRARRIAGDAALGVARRRRAPASTSRSTAAHPTSPAGASPTPTGRSSPPPSCSATRWVATTWRLALEAAVDDCIDDGALSPDLGGSMGTAAIGAAVRDRVVRRLRREHGGGVSRMPVDHRREGTRVASPPGDVA